MTEDKTKLLRSLAIDRSAGEATPAARRRWLLPAAGGAIVVAAAVIGVFVLSELRALGHADPVVAQSRAPPAPQPQQPAPVANDPGALVASGYVVARRKATVAAEITGKVVEVLIDEGMTV